MSTEAPPSAQLPFAQVDVFGPRCVMGNPVAVVLEADGLDGVTMQQIASWTNLSETAFLLAPRDARADYRARIFTPLRELPFAGHPTLGSAHAWAEATGMTGRDVLVQECAAGLVDIRRSHDRLAFAAPPLLREGPLDDETLDEVCTTLAIDGKEVVDHAWADNGPGWAAVLLDDPQRVLSLTPTRPRRPTAVLAVHSPHALEVRAFMTTGAEDPATGSLNAAIAPWLLSSGRMTAPYIAHQGTALGRDCQIHVDEQGGTIWIGGETRTVVSGALRR